MSLNGSAVSKIQSEAFEETSPCDVSCRHEGARIFTLKLPSQRSFRLVVA